MVNKTANRGCGGSPRQAEDMTAKIDMKEKNTSRQEAIAGGQGVCGGVSLQPAGGSSSAGGSSGDRQ